jgi:hypothetical protein
MVTAPISRIAYIIGRLMEGFFFEDAGSENWVDSGAVSVFIVTSFQLGIIKSLIPGNKPCVPLS